MTKLTTPGVLPSSQKPIRFTSTLASEWTKLWTVRFTYRMLAVTFALAAIMSAVFCLTTGVTENKSLADLSPTDVVEASLLGTDFAVIVLIVLAASAVASEYSTGLIQLSLTATPARWKVLAAKAIALTSTALLAGGLATLIAVGTGQFILLTQGLPLMSLSDTELLRLVLGTMLMPPFYALVSVAFAFLTRSGGGAIAAVLTIMLIPAVVSWLPPLWRGALLPLLPVSALHSLSGAATPGTLEYLVPGWAAVVLIVWAATLLVAAYVSVNRRDACI